MANSHISLILPKDYKPVKFPGLTEILAALRSGKFEKCKGHLCKYVGLKEGKPQFQYCTLGVMTVVFTEIIRKEQIKKQVNNIEDSSLHPTFELLHLAHPPNDVLYFFFTDRIGSFPRGVYVANVEDGIERKQYRSISHINDAAELDLSFSEIADLLEKIYSDSSHTPITNTPTTHV